MIIGACAQPVNNSRPSVAKEVAQSPAKSSLGVATDGGNLTASSGQSNTSNCTPVINLGEIAGLPSIEPRGATTCTSSVSQPGSQSGASPLTSTDWAVGAYSTDTGLSTETTDWDNLPSSFTMTGVTQASFMVNSPTSGGGSFYCGSTKETFSGLIIQVAAVYNSGVYSYAFPEAVIIMPLSGSTAGYYTAAWSTNLGSAPIITTAEYETYNSITGWWVILTYGTTSVYLMSISTADGIDFNVAASQSATPCSGYGSLSITSLGTTSSTVTTGSSGQISFDPSVAMEVSESSSGNFLSDNSNLAIDSVVTSGEFYYYGVTATQDFNIGENSPPSTAYAGGVTHEYSVNNRNSYFYYDQFGTNSGVQSFIESNWSLLTATTTQTTTTNLPTLNWVCTGSTCPPAPPPGVTNTLYPNTINPHSEGNAPLTYLLVASGLEGSSGIPEASFNLK